MDQQVLDSVLERLDRVEQHNRRLERQNARLKLGGLAALAAVGALLAIGMTNTPQVVEARKFVVRDAQGRVRATLGPADKAWPAMYPEWAPKDEQDREK